MGSFWSGNPGIAFVVVVVVVVAVVVVVVVILYQSISMGI